MNVGEIKIKGKGIVETPEEVQKRHEAMVLRLAKPGQAILDTLTPEDCYLIHIAACIPGEASELYEAWQDDDVTMVEELGDMEFYMTALRQILNLPRNADTTVDDTVDGCLIVLMVEGGKLWDVVKRRTIYRKDLNVEEAIRCTRALEARVNTIIQLTDHKLTEILNENFKKLADKDKGRYASGSYSDQQAQDRRDKPGGR